MVLLTVSIKNVPMAFIMTFGPPIGSESDLRYKTRLNRGRHAFKCSQTQNETRMIQITQLAYKHEISLIKISSF